MEQVAGEPHVVGHGQHSGILAVTAAIADLEFPLARHDLGIEAVVAEPRFDAEASVRFRDLTTEGAVGPDAAIVRPLRERQAGFRKTQRAAILQQRVLLLEPDPGIFAVDAGVHQVAQVRAGVGGVRRAVGVEHFAQDEIVAALTGGIAHDPHRDQRAIAVMAVGLAGRRAVEAPFGKVPGAERVYIGFIDEPRLRAQTLRRCGSIEPDVFCECHFDSPFASFDRRERSHSASEEALKRAWKRGRLPVVNRVNGPDGAPRRGSAGFGLVQQQI